MQKSQFAEFLKTHKRLIQQEKAATIDLQTAVAHSKHSQKILHFLTQTDRLAAQERTQEAARVQSHLEAMKKQLTVVQNAISTSPENLKTLLLTTESNLTSARQGWIQARNDLEARGQQLSNDISNGFRRFETAENSVKKPVPETVKIVKIQSKSRELAKIEEELIRIKFPYQGWTQEQHERFFVQWLNSKSGNRRRFCELLIKKFPEFTIGALLRHDEFCFQVQELQDRKKREVAKWRERKEEGVKELEFEGEASGGVQRVKNGKNCEKIRAFREQKQMVHEDVISQQFADKIKQIQQLKQAKKRAQQALIQRKQAAERVKSEQVAVANQLIKEQEDMIVRRKLGIKSDDDLRREKMSEKLKKEREMEIQRIKIIQQENQLQKQSEAERKEKMYERARNCIPEANGVRDVERLYKPTNAQQSRIKEVQQMKELKKAGKGRFSDINVGYDPFAVIPISGGLRRGGW